MGRHVLEFVLMNSKQRRSAAQTEVCAVRCARIDPHEPIALGTNMGQTMNLATSFDDGYELDDGEERHLESPSTFYLPPADVRSSLQPGQIVKLIFRISLEDEAHAQTQEVERMWVIVDEPMKGGRYLGHLDNDPRCTKGISSGMKVVFEPRHVVQVHSSAA